MLFQVTHKTVNMELGAIIGIVILGLAAGVLSSMVGIGGGIVIV
ncbi:MAG: hypothetical protein RIQ62_1487, partial [Bacteroidota bacterium]